VPYSFRTVGQCEPLTCSATRCWQKAQDTLSGRSGLRLSTGVEGPSLRSHLSACRSSTGDKAAAMVLGKCAITVANASPSRDSHMARVTGHTRAFGTP